MKKKIAIYLEPHNEFLKDVAEKSRLINLLLDKEFGTKYSADESENDQFEIEKIIRARRLLADEKGKAIES